MTLADTIVACAPECVILVPIKPFYSVTENENQKEQIGNALSVTISNYLNISMISKRVDEGDIEDYRYTIWKILDA